jgi:hypothetical protein
MRARNVNLVPRAGTGFEYTLYLNKWTSRKLSQISKRAKRPKQHLTIYLVDYAIEKQYYRFFQEHEKVADRIELKIFAGPHWWEKLGDFAWSTNIYMQSAGHFGGLSLAAALRDKRTDSWVRFFTQGQDLQERAIRYITNWTNERPRLKE